MENKSGLRCNLLIMSQPLRPPAAVLRRCTSLSTRTRPLGPCTDSVDNFVQNRASMAAHPAKRLHFNSSMTKQAAQSALKSSHFPQVLDDTGVEGTDSSNGAPCGQVRPEMPVSEPFFTHDDGSARRVWAVGPLMQAIADVLSVRFNPVAVRGEISGFSRAASGHCYFSLKDESGQLRCAMFRRAADQLQFVPRDGLLCKLRAGWMSMVRVGICS